MKLDIVAISGFGKISIFTLIVAQNRLLEF